jgi:UDP-3-O-[3-hydroxymyristoyl] glucosamine N-acyltransferase
MQALSTDEIARHTGGELQGDSGRMIRGVAPLDTATPEHLSFLTGARYVSQARTTRAGALLLPRELRCELPPGTVAIRVDDSYAALAVILPILYPEDVPVPGVDATARVGEGAQIHPQARVEAYAVIGSDARIDRGARVGAHTVVGERCVIGSDAVLHSHVTVYHDVMIGERCIIHSGARIGADGFGYVLTAGRHRKVPQVGGCRLEDEVEIGANTTIDRGSVGDTVIGVGTKIDNLVQVGHNCRIGRHVIIIAQVGISGSTVIEDYAVMGGQSATAGHLSIGAGARVAGRAAVTADVPPGQTVSGYPARPHREAMRAQAAVFRLPSMLKRLERLERSLFGGSSGDDRRGDSEHPRHEE